MNGSDGDEGGATWCAMPTGWFDALMLAGEAKGTCRGKEDSVMSTHQVDMYTGRCRQCGRYSTDDECPGDTTAEALRFAMQQGANGGVSLGAMAQGANQAAQAAWQRAKQQCLGTTDEAIPPVDKRDRIEAITTHVDAHQHRANRLADRCGALEAENTALKASLGQLTMQVNDLAKKLAKAKR